MEHQYYIPRRLNDPPRLFFWDMDVAIVFLSALMLGLLANAPSLGIVGAVISGYYFGKAKSGRHPAYTIHIAYWYSPVASSMNVLPPSYLREMNG
jgi:conjugal transfer pilus assembly protein TraL